MHTIPNRYAERQKQETIKKRVETAAALALKNRKPQPVKKNKEMPAAAVIPSTLLAPPPKVHDMHYLFGIDLQKITVASNRVIDLAYLRKIYGAQKIGLKIIYGDDPAHVYFFTSQAINFDHIRSRLHPLCRNGETLIAKPHPDCSHYFERNGDRIVIFGETRLVFSKTPF